MTNYERGVEKERKAQEQLRAVGCKAMRTAGSHGIADVIAVCPSGVRLIQIKRAKQDQDWKADFEGAVEAMDDLIVGNGISKEVWLWVDYQGWKKQKVVE